MPVKDPKKSLFVYKLAKAGAIAIGIVYVLIGVVALLSLMHLSNSGANGSGILNLIKEIPLGKAILALVFAGLIAYIIWKFYNAIDDPYGYGNSYMGLSKRAGIAGAGLAYGVIAYSAVQVFLGTSTSTGGSSQSQQNMVAKILSWTAGEWIVGAAGVLVGITAIAQFMYVIKRGYREKLNVKNVAASKIKVVAVLAWIGHFARGITLLVIAYFLVKAAIQSDPSDVVNTDKAFNFLGDKVGSLPFILVAAGTICYGFYMFALSRYYNFQDDFT